MISSIKIWVSLYMQSENDTKMKNTWKHYEYGWKTVRIVS